MQHPGVQLSQLRVTIKVTLPEQLLRAPKAFERKLPSAVRKIAMEGKSFWKAEAGRKLRASRNAYQQGINFTMVDTLSFELTLTDPLGVAVETGAPGFDMKPGLLKNALPWPPTGQKRKIPRAVAANIKGPITRYRVIPLNTNHYVNMTKPRMFRTVHDRSPKRTWKHPGWRKGKNLAAAVIKELDTQIIPKRIAELLKETL